MKKYLHMFLTALSVIAIIFSQTKIVEASTPPPRYQAPRFHSIEQLTEWIETEDTWAFQSGRFMGCLASARSYGEILIPSFDSPDITLRSIGVLPNFQESGRFVHSGYMLTNFSYSTPTGPIIVTIHRLNSSYAEAYERYGIEGFGYARISGMNESHQSIGEKIVLTRDSYTGGFEERTVSYIRIDFLDTIDPFAVIFSVIDGREVHIQYHNEESRIHFENMVLETIPIVDREITSLRQDPNLSTTPDASAQRVIRFEIGSTVHTIDGVAYTNDAAPFIDPTYNRTMIPLRAVSEALGAEADWISQTLTVQILTDADTHYLTVDVPLPDGMGIPVNLRGRVFVPIRYVAEILGATTRWDSANSAVYIYQ